MGCFFRFYSLYSTDPTQTMLKPKHNSYQIADFLDDLSFINAIKHKEETDVGYWKEWVSSEPPNLDAYKAAETQLNLILSSARIVPTEAFTEKLWTDINLSITQDQQKKIRHMRRVIFASAAAIALLFTSFAVWFFNSNIVINTPYGKTQEVLLPDGSRILLNANTTLEYPRAYNWFSARNVSLKGEAYFKVTHGLPFSAHTKNLTVQVLGTEFNIKERRGTTLVALVKGKIAVKGTNGRLKTQVMKPSELFRYDENTKEAVKSHANPQVYTAWINNKALAENATVGSIIKDFEDIYGQQIILENPTLYNRVIDGVIPMGDKENTLFVIANILNVQIHKQGDTILLKTRKAK